MICGGTINVNMAKPKMIRAPEFESCQSITHKSTGCQQKTAIRMKRLGITKRSEIFHMNIHRSIIIKGKVAWNPFYGLVIQILFGHK